MARAIQGAGVKTGSYVLNWDSLSDDVRWDCVSDSMVSLDTKGDGNCSVHAVVGATWHDVEGYGVGIGCFST